MKTLLHRVVAILSIAIALATGSVLVLADGNGPVLKLPLRPIVESSRLLFLHGRVPGQVNGTVPIRIKLHTAINPLIDLTSKPMTLLEETQSIAITNEEFTVWVGSATSGGVDPGSLSSYSNIGISYALESAPDKIIDDQPVSSAAFAMSIVPGATVQASRTGPLLELSNKSGPALSATTAGAIASAAVFTVQQPKNVQAAISGTSNGTGGRGVSGVSTATQGASYGIEGLSASVTGAGGLFVNSGGGDLLVASNSKTGVPIFRVDNQGRIFINGIQVGLKGDKGSPGTPGSQGSQGVAGPPGPPGAPGRMTFCLADPGSSCIGKCTGGATLVGQSFAPCTASSNTGLCPNYSYDGGVCCVCSH